MVIIPMLHCICGLARFQISPQACACKCASLPSTLGGWRFVLRLAMGKLKCTRVQALHCHAPQWVGAWWALQRWGGYY